MQVAPVSSPTTNDLASANQTTSANGHSLADKVIEQNENIEPFSILSQLTAILSEKSGYPEDLLDPDQDLESDLGIDSIKRIEVMGGFMSSLSQVSPDTTQNIQNGTRELRTLREVAEKISSVLSEASNTSANTEVSQPGK